MKAGLYVVEKKLKVFSVCKQSNGVLMAYFGDCVFNVCTSSGEMMATESFVMMKAEKEL